jgi:hypothetical protein
MTSTLPDALSVLSAMITPAVLISACGSLIMATSDRLNRAVDRARELAGLFAALQAAPPGGEMLDEERRMLFAQLDLSTSRSRLLQRALARLYSALGTFVGTSVAIGIVAVSGRQYTWLPVGLGLLGAALLLYASLLLVRESRVALAALEAEMDFIWSQGRHRATPELLNLHRSAEGGFFRRRRK